MAYAFVHYPRTPGGDNVVVAYNDVCYFNVDTLELPIGISFLYQRPGALLLLGVLDFASEEQVKEGYRKIKDVAKKYNSAQLNDETIY
jgi:hypothetical protein